MDAISGCSSCRTLANIFRRHRASSRKVRLGPRDRQTTHHILGYHCKLPLPYCSFLIVRRFRSADSSTKARVLREIVGLFGSQTCLGLILSLLHRQRRREDCYDAEFSLLCQPLIGDTTAHEEVSVIEVELGADCISYGSYAATRTAQRLVRREGLRQVGDLCGRDHHAK